MTLPFEKQVASIELAKRLKELGVKQESYFYWEIGRGHENVVVSHYDQSRVFRYASAFTVAELGEMLPDYTETHKWEKALNPKHPDRWICRNENDAPGYNTSDNTEADARAKMLVYLIEQGVVKP